MPLVKWNMVAPGRAGLFWKHSAFWARIRNLSHSPNPTTVSSSRKVCLGCVSKCVSGVSPETHFGDTLFIIRLVSSCQKHTGLRTQNARLTPLYSLCFCNLSYKKKITVQGLYQCNSVAHVIKIHQKALFAAKFTLVGLRDIPETHLETHFL